MIHLAPELLQRISENMRGFWRPMNSTHSLPLRILPDENNASAMITKKNLEAIPGVEKTMKAACGYLQTLQTKEGYWEGPIYDNVTMTAEYVMTLRFLGLLTPDIAQKAKKTILNCQCSDHGWCLFGEGPSDHSATLEAYFALKLCGMANNDPLLLTIKEKIISCGGIETTRIFTKIHLAMFGQYPWKKIPVINPELMLLPKQAPIHIYEFSSWSRSVIIPLLILFHHKPIIPLMPSENIQYLWIKTNQRKKRNHVRELFKNPMNMEQIFEVAQNAIVLYEKFPVKPFRKKALAMAEKWIIDHQDADGNWGGIFPAIANSIMALHLRGYALDHPILQKGLSTLRSFSETTKDHLRMQSTISPVWDTCIASYALSECNISAKNPLMQLSKDWIVKKQILNKKGDWKFKAKNVRPGGWPFEHENDHYPDIDDSALAILSLLPFEEKEKHEKISDVTNSIDRGIEWILGMQGKDGGWGAFDKDNNRHILNQIPFADLKSLIDPSTPDVTGHVIEALGVAGYERNSIPIRRAIAFLKRTQEHNGSWFGRWGIDYIYGAGAVLSGLAKTNEDMNSPYIQKACHWLTTIQNIDGGWGESCFSYNQGTYVPLHHSTPSQTAWALLGLLASPTNFQPAIEKGIRYLVQSQKKDGSWKEAEWTGTGFPRHFYLRYDYYRLYFPTLALGRYVFQKKSDCTKLL